MEDHGFEGFVKAEDQTLILPDEDGIPRPCVMTNICELPPLRYLWKWDVGIGIVQETHLKYSDFIKF